MKQGMHRDIGEVARHASRSWGGCKACIEILGRLQGMHRYLKGVACQGLAAGALCVEDAILTLKGRQ